LKICAKHDEVKVGLDGLPEVLELIKELKAKGENKPLEVIKIPESTLKVDMKRLLDGKGAPYDFTVGLVKCHRSILSARSPFFNGMLTTHMRENTESKAETHIPESALKGLLEYLYTGEIEQIKSYDDAVVLYENMNYFFLDEEKYHEKFRIHCTKILESNNYFST